VAVNVTWVPDIVGDAGDAESFTDVQACELSE
jgi:hypothetical protein